MSVATFQSIWNICNSVLSYSFNIFGISVSMLNLLLFSLVVTVTLFTLFKLFNIQ